MLHWNDEKFDKHFGIMLFNQGDTCIAVYIVWNWLMCLVFNKSQIKQLKDEGSLSNFNMW